MSSYSYDFQSFLELRVNKSIVIAQYKKFLFLPQIAETMNLLKLTACILFSFVTLISISSCEKESEKRKSNLYIKSDIPFTGAQIKPVSSPSAGTGTMDVWYDKRDGVLNYAIRWSGLSDSIIAIRISGPAPIGFNTVNPAFNPAPASFNAYSTTPYLSTQTFLGSSPKALYPSSGTFSGSIFVDGAKVKEEDVLSGQYYVTLHTKTVLPIAPPGSYLFRWLGEVRAQIAFD
ncbi:MAG: CHRD domain-containing protein [Chitinophagaceae bacterium]|nr:MAG: CHRD domain-containing protein [Chitinophagaceae bacterium]